MDNSIEQKQISELLGMKFFIPSYQRGYRWTEQQVRDLLNDVNEFKPQKQNESGEETWYCLQPLIVRKMDETDVRLSNEENKKEWYEVIDGQQRLTTVFLIIHYFNEMWIGKIKQKLPVIRYQTRDDSFSFLNSLEINIETDFVKYDSDSAFIDHYYMAQAYNEIHRWVKEQTNFNNNDFQSKFIYKTQFIWYESVDEDPIKVFTRLNIGKISLTNAELIKALFLNRSNFVIDDDNNLKLRQQEIASEWDKIEYTLQNDEFWLFLNQKGYDRPTRIDFIFDLICSQNQLALKKEKYEIIGNDEYRTFRYFYEYFKKDQYREPNIDLCWKKIKSHFQTFLEWYVDLELYHYIGFLVEYKFCLSDLIKKWEEAPDKSWFVRYIKGEIKHILEVSPQLDYQYKEDGSDKGKCKPILLFHNIQTIINQNTNNKSNEKYHLSVFYKFPFHLYKLESWDVEHINSNTTNDEDDVDTQKEWLLNVYLSANCSTQQKIRSYLEDTDQNKKALFDEIKKEFPQNEEWTPEEKNRIWNYTLLDSSTNRSYGNTIFSGKRRVIIGKDKGKLIALPKISKDGILQVGEETVASSSFVPPCTKQVFMKYYSTAMSEYNYWTKTDAEGYLNDIEECIKKLED